MAFVLHRPPSPSPRESEEDVLSAALHAALQPFSTSTGLQSNPYHGTQSPHPTYTAQTDEMHREKAEKGHPSVDIAVNSDTLILRGTGVDVEPALLSGNVVLHLSEATSIKEITLQFRGKARIPPSANESLALNSSPLTYVVCNHEWSFLEGTKTHAHTLKAGRHLFPFQLHIGGSLPSSIGTTALGGASVHYKLRATVVRPYFGLHHRDLHSIHPIHIVRGFSPEALEYQQTLEIENTWPEKLMYSIMVPHKAWAAGDRVTAVVKFSPLVKGARVQNVTTMINETVKLFGRAGGCQETTRTIATTKHDFHGARAVCVDEQHHRFRVPLLHHTAQSHSLTGSRGTSTPASPLQTNSGSSYFPPQPATHSPGEMTPLTTVTTNSSSSSSSAPHAGPSAGASSSSIGISPISSAPESEAHVPIGIELPAELEEEPSQDVVTTLHISVPLHATPAHALEPIQVSHRIRWSIMIGNLDGHTSELRCSLPLHLLDHRLYDEAHSATLQTRRLLLGAQDVEGGQAVDTHGEASDNEEDMELPSYPAHVRDRVANAYLPDTGIMRVTNPWIAQGISPVIMTEPRTESSSGLQSPAPLECFQINGAPPAQTGGSNPSVNPRNHLPQVPPPDAQQLHWVNSELLLSMTRQPDQLPASVTRRSPRESRPHSMTPPETTSIQPSRHGSRFPSRRPSRANSRSGSPERSSSDGASVHSADTYVHSSSTASRNLHGLFHMSMKPFTSLTSGFSLGHRSSSSNNLSSGYPHGHSHLGHIAATGHSPTDIRNSRSPSGNSTPISPGPHTPPLVNVPHRHMTQDQMLLHRAFIETPDYEIASRGFLGGGIPPLSSYTGLPSYEEAAESRASIERSMSEPDLISARAAPSIHAQLPPPEQLTGPVTAPPSPLGHAS